MPNSSIQIPLWADHVPLALGADPEDSPSLHVWLPPSDRATGAAFVILPGGGYRGLSDHEGEGYAQWLCRLGIAGIVLRYRLGRHGYRHPAMLLDAHRAMRVTRTFSAEWGIDPSRVGIIGSSAGGHLAATLLSYFDPGQPGHHDPIERHSSRPDIAVLCYPVITMGAKTNMGSRNNCIGENPPTSLIEELSCERHVKSDTPPCFIWHTWEDSSVPVENALNYATALREKNIPFELHIYEKGKHGMGLGNISEQVLHRWHLDCEAWLREHSFVRN